MGNQLVCHGCGAVMKTLDQAKLHKCGDEPKPEAAPPLGSNEAPGYTSETLDRLYLEWSQFTKAKTARELRLETAFLAAKAFIDSHVADPDITPKMEKAYAAYQRAARAAGY